MADQSIVIFGAGKIGRSFIGQLFGKAGFEVVFVDMDQSLVEELNRRRAYPVVIKGPDKDERLVIENVRAIHSLNQHAVMEAISRTDVMAISVGKNSLQVVAPIVASGLLVREHMNPGKILDIILAENMRSADLFFEEKLLETLPRSYPIKERVGLVETSIGKMVPIMTNEDLDEDPLQVFAEPYNSLILDRLGFLGEIPQIEEFALKDNIKAWVDRKAFIHNLGHAAAAYYGQYFLPDIRHLHEVLENRKVFEFTRRVMIEGAGLLKAVYPQEFTDADLTKHINDLLYRFLNRNLGDTIFRIGSDLQRKFGPDDRFMATIRLAIKKGVPYGMILEAMAMGFCFKAKDENEQMFPGDIDFRKRVSENLDEVLEHICGLQPSSDFLLISQLKKQIEKLSHSNA